MIQDLPTSKDFGLGFNYERWTANTNITLCSVPWNTDYRDVVRFDDQGALNSYLTVNSGPTITLPNATYAKFGRPVSIDLDFSIAQQYNYLRVYNPAQPNNNSLPQYFYYFIVDVAYGATNTTHLILQLDVFQTFIYSTQFGNCYIDRGHVGIANDQGFNHYGRDYLTIPEGLDIGGEYGIVRQYNETIASTYTSDRGTSYDILVVSTVNLTVDPGTVDNPNLQSATGSLMGDLPNGAEIYAFTGRDNFIKFLQDYSSYPWMTQGIISIMAIPDITLYGITYDNITLPKSTVPLLKLRPGRINKRSNSMQTSWRDQVQTDIPARYQHLKKFLTFPYCVLELTTHTGTPVVIKPELWNTPNATVVEVAHLAPPSARLSMYPYRYNALDSSTAESDSKGVLNDGGEFLDMATSISNFPTFSIVNNAGIGYLASNANSIAYQHSSADWSQQKALQGNQLSNDQAHSGIATGRDINNIGINAAKQQTALQNQLMGSSAFLNAGAGISGGIAGGPMGIGKGVADAALTGVKTAINIDGANQAMGISTGASRASNDRGNSNAAYVADSNKSYADFASRGDYENSIAGINAKVQDAKLIQPTTSGQMGGEAFLLSSYRWGYDLKVKMVSGASLTAVGEYWLRYGYAVSKFGRMPDNLNVMTKFSYWKLKETYIVQAKCPESFKQTLRGIFEKGVTVWKNPADIGNIDIGDNMPLEGIRL